MDVAKNYQITTLINLLLTLLHSQPLSRSAFLTEYVTFQPCVQSITRSRRRTYKYACHLFKKRGGSCLVCFNARYTRDSFFSPPPSLPPFPFHFFPPSLPPFFLPSFFQTTSSAETVCKPEGAKAEEKKTGECSFNLSIASLFGDLCAIRTVSKFGLITL